MVFARYNLMGALAGAAGALLSAVLSAVPVIAAERWGVSMLAAQRAPCSSSTRPARSEPARCTPR